MLSPSLWLQGGWLAEPGGVEKSGVIQQGGGVRAPMYIWGLWGVIPPVEVPVSPEELVVAQR